MKLPLFKFHLLFEKVVVNIGDLTPVEPTVLAVSRTFVFIFNLAKKIVFLLVIVICVEGLRRSNGFSFFDLVIIILHIINN